ncbi:mitochondrial import receptor subunit Tom22 [Cryptotrichosporon argae]
MVLVEEVPEDLHAGERESDFMSDSGSEVSDVSSVADDDFDPLSETLYDRLVALQDIVPPTTRARLSKTYTAAADWYWWTYAGAGNVIWWGTTSALLIGLPLALAIEDEARITQQEKELQMQSAGQQQLLSGPQQPQGVVPAGF